MKIPEISSMQPKSEMEVQKDSTVQTQPKIEVQKYLNVQSNEKSNMQLKSKIGIQKGSRMQLKSSLVFHVELPSKHCDTGPIPARYRHYCWNGTGPALFSRYQGNGHLPLCTSAFYRPGAVNRNLTSNIQHRKVSLPASLCLLSQYRASNGPLYLTSINWYKPITGQVSGQ